MRQRVTAGLPAVQLVLAVHHGIPHIGASLNESRAFLVAYTCSLFPAEFKLILRQLGSVMPDDGVAALAARFSTGRAGQIDCGELRRALRGAMGAGTGA